MRPFVLLWGCLQFGVLAGQTWNPPVLQTERQADLAQLDAVLNPRLLETAQGEEGLAARDAVVSAMLEPGVLPALDWALLLHGWVRSAGDAHLRVRFDRFAVPREDYGEVAMDFGDGQGACWEKFGPSPLLPPSARASWFQRTRTWVCPLSRAVEGCACHTETRLEGSGAVQVPETSMSVEDHGAFVRWLMPSFGVGSAADFRRSFRRSFRRIRKAGLPVMLDLRGNLGGYRTRRHAVLSAFLDVESWPVEMEGPWSLDTLMEPVPPMPLVQVSRPLDVPVAVMLDGMSFSASLLLADALLLSGRCEVFGEAPLGGRGGCSGSPESIQLVGSGLWVDVPTRQTELGAQRPGSWGLPEEATSDSGVRGWREAVQWLLSADLIPIR